MRSPRSKLGPLGDHSIALQKTRSSYDHHTLFLFYIVQVSCAQMKHSAGRAVCWSNQLSEVCWCTTISVYNLVSLIHVNDLILYTQMHREPVEVFQYIYRCYLLTFTCFGDKPGSCILHPLQWDDGFEVPAENCCCSLMSMSCCFFYFGISELSAGLFVHSEY
jgi:hypothetical protein